MNTSEQLIYLINYLRGEDKRYENILMPSTHTDRFNLYRSLVNVRMPSSISEEYLEIEDTFLQAEIKKKGITRIDDLNFNNDGICIWQGDITTLECDAIVNAANSQMLGCFCPCHACIDNCIHTFSGVRLRLKCNELMTKQGYSEPTGQAKITPAYNLPCKYVIHTVGPIAIPSLTAEHESLLESCYNECLKMADDNKLESIAFCCISTGEFRFPNKRAAEIAHETVMKYKMQNKSDIKVIFNVFKDIDKRIYEGLIN